MGHSNAAFRVRRRIFLSAVGLGLSAAVASRLSSVALAQATPASKRFLLFYMPHGAPPEHFAPPVMGNDPTQFSLSAPGVGILGPLEEQLKAYTTVVQGITYPKGASTHEALVVALSGLSGPGGTSLPDDAVARVTLEHQIAAGLNVEPLILGACAHRPFGLDKDGKLMWDGTPVVPEKNPLAAYDAVFSGLGATPGPAPGTDPDVELTNSLRSLTEGELQALSQELTGLTDEQTKLKLHLDAIASLKAGGGGGAISCTSAPSLPALEALRTAAAGQSDDFFLKEENFPKILAAQLAVAGAALKCNARQVVAVQPMYTNCEFDFGFMGSSGPHHSLLSHTQPQADPYPAKTLQVTARQAFAKCQRWFMEQLFTHTLAGLLEPDPADPSKKVIDNTVVYIMSEIGDGAWHTTGTKLITTSGAEGVLTYIPSVIIGGGGGALKPGRVVTHAQDRPAGDLYRSLCQAMGVTGTFPDSTGAMAEVLA